MVYTTFSTDNADYVLQLGNHVTENKQVDIFEGIDALILETGEGSLEDYLENDPRYELSLQYCADNNTPVFGTDVAPTLSGSLRGRISFTPAVLLGPFASHYGDNPEKINNLILNICANYQFILQDLLIEGRNALNAEKIDGFVAPLLAERLGRKPSLGLIFGYLHCGLKPDLQSKRRRDFTIWNWRNFNFGKWSGFYEEELNLIHEANYNGKEWGIQTYTPPLFD